MGYDLKTAQESNQRVLSPVEEAALAKEPERQALALDIQRFLAGGGRIVHLPAFISRGDKLLDMRAGNVHLISFEQVGKRWDVPTRALALTLGKWPSLLYIIKDDQRWYALDDIERCEQTPDFKIHKVSL